MKLRVDGETIELRFRRKLGTFAQGYAKGGEYGDGRIDIATNQTRSGQRSVALHEFLHYAIERSGLKMPARTEEAFCDAVDVWLYLLLKQNPEFVEWLTEELS